LALKVDKEVVVKAYLQKIIHYKTKLAAITQATNTGDHDLQAAMLLQLILALKVDKEAGK
jgi:hypothetical protein